MISDSKNNYCVIMAGGIGSRFWPRSNKKLPKQFIDFLGTGRTLIQTTFDRFLKIVPLDHIFVITTHDDKTIRATYECLECMNDIFDTIITLRMF